MISTVYTGPRVLGDTEHCLRPKNTPKPQNLQKRNVSGLQRVRMHVDQFRNLYNMYDNGGVAGPRAKIKNT